MIRKEEPELRRVRIEGRVQGVGFRASTREQARRVGVAGWVRNCPDGAVEAVFEGTAEQVAAMVDWCRQGPRWARVERVEESCEPPRGLRGFEIR